jgi:uncharacterized protein
MLVKDPQEIRKILEETKTIAVVGFSDDPGRGASYYVPEHMYEAGYRIIPVNPDLTEGLGEKCYPSLLDIPKTIPVDMVNCFRRPEFIPDIARQAIAIGAKVLWMQMGITSGEAVKIASDASLKVVQSLCLMKEYNRLLR